MAILPNTAQYIRDYENHVFLKNLRKNFNFPPNHQAKPPHLPGYWPEHHDVLQYRGWWGVETSTKNGTLQGCSARTKKVKVGPQSENQVPPRLLILNQSKSCFSPGFTYCINMASWCVYPHFQTHKLIIFLVICHSIPMMNAITSPLNPNHIPNVDGFVSTFSGSFVSHPMIFHYPMKSTLYYVIFPLSSPHCQFGCQVNIPSF